MTSPSFQTQSPNFPPPSTNLNPKQYIPQYSPQTVWDNVKGKSITEIQQQTYMAGAEKIAIDKGALQSEVCANIMIGLAQVKEGVKKIKSKKDSLSDSDWDSDSDDSYREYVDNFVSYMTEVSGFFEALSKRIVNDAEIFEEMNTYISNAIRSEIDISNWR
jgi:argonaute-like protein implicated in RNA metabolism and viral defense